MYKNILVPVDGSELAECVLPHVESVAKGCGVGNIIFIRVVEPFRPPALGDDQGYTYGPEELEKIDIENGVAAERYLNKLMGRVKYDGIPVRTEVLRGGRAADMIADYATKGEVDLIIMSTHGRSGVSRWVLGSVADRIVRSSCVPVLMVRAPGCFPGI